MHEACGSLFFFLQKNIQKGKFKVCSDKNFVIISEMFLVSKHVSFIKVSKIV